MGTNRYQIGCIVVYAITGKQHVVTGAEYSPATDMWQYQLDGRWTAAEFELAWE